MENCAEPEVSKTLYVRTHNSVLVDRLPVPCVPSVSQHAQPTPAGERGPAVEQVSRPYTAGGWQETSEFLL